MPRNFVASFLSLALLAPTAVPAGDPLPNGWNATFTQNGRAVTTCAPSAAFLLEEGESIHPRVGADGLRCIFGASVRIASAGRYRFGFELEGGAAQFSVTSTARQPLGEVASSGATTAFTDWITLPQGEVELVLSFQRDGARRARLRTLWEMELAQNAGFPAEPLPSSAARVLPSFEAGVARALQELDGRVLLEQKGCTNCHAPGASCSLAVGLRRGPDLARAGGRAGVEWLARWIASPASIRPKADMPDLFGEGEDQRADARAIASFLASLAPPESPAPIEASLVDAGRELYHERGCVACHGALATQAALHDDEFLSDAMPMEAVRAPFGELAGKWDAKALADLLVDPLAVYPDGRMPSLGLERGEAERIAAYLASSFGNDANATSADAEIASEIIERGRRAFVAKGCVACHVLEAAGDLPVDHGPPLDALDPSRGCLDPKDAGSPRYELDDSEREALAAGLRSAQQASGAPAPIDAARRRVALLGCASCHAIDGRGGVPEALRDYFTTREDVDLGDEGRIPPALSGVGSKLETAWLQRVLEDAGRARPYMGARMPQFGAEAVKGLADGFARTEGVQPHTDLAPPPSTDAMVLAGRELMGRGAFACITCHVFDDYPVAGTPGVDLKGFAERLRYEWFRSFLFDPARYKPGTRMPSFGAGGRSTITSVLDGDMRRQIDAMWAYFQLGEAMPPPPDLEPSSTMQLTVGAEPRVFRGFLASAGSRAIAVGFPVGTHYAFDANAVRLVEAWKGDFLDASGSWANRGGMENGGRGPVVWTAPAGPPLVVGERPTDWPQSTGRDAGYRFRGYRIGKDGVPELLYSVRGARVSERIEPRVDRALARDFRLSGLPPNARVWLRAGEKDRLFERFQAIGERPLQGQRGKDGFTWYGLEPRAGELGFRWEVAL